MSGRFAAALARFAAFFRKDALDRDLDAELESHLALAIDDNLRRGLAPEEARRQALASLGGKDATRERHRDARGLPGLDSLLQDVRFAVRSLGRELGFSSVVVAVLAVGIGASTAIFSVVDGVLLRPAPLKDLESLAMVWETDRKSGTTREPASLPDFLDFQGRARGFARLCAFTASEVNLVPPGGEPVRLAALEVSHDFTELLGIAALVGRSFRKDEDVARGPAVAMISESLWERALGRAPEAIGGTLRLDDGSYTVVGVVPDAADFGVLQVLNAAAYSRSFADRGRGARVDVWLPLQGNPEELPRDTHPLFVLGRLAPGVSAGAAGEEMATIAAALEREYASNAHRGVFVEPLADVVFSQSRRALAVLLAAVGLVMLAACANAATLLLARGTGRTREVAVRTALGGGKWRLARQFLVESLVLVLAAALAGIALAELGLRVLLALAPAEVPRIAAVSIDLRVLAATLGMSLVVGLLLSLVPLFQARRVDLQAALHSEGSLHASAAPGLGRLRALLVVAETALAVVLLVGASLLIQSFWRLRQTDPGFRVAGVLKAEYQLPASRYPVDFNKWPNFREIHAFNDALLRRAQALPGVDAAAVAGNHPLDHGFTNSFTIVGREAEAGDFPELSIRRVTGSYFRTVGLTLRKGRLLADSDGTLSPSVAVINEAAAKRFFPGRDPIGAQLALWGAARSIVGIVADERFHGVDQAPPLAAYLPLSQAPSANGSAVLLVRTKGDPAALAPAVRRAVRELDPGLAAFGVETLEDTLSQSVAGRRFTTLVLGVFAAITLALAALGLHGVLSYGIARRRREIGVRLALGAHPNRVLRAVLAEAVWLALAGAALGLVGALAGARLLASLLFGVLPNDLPSFAGSGLLLVLLALVVSYFPALRATRVDPAIALRVD